jgi:drug/metabolite transporter (DMT)-like permease
MNEKFRSRAATILAVAVSVGVVVTTLAIYLEDGPLRDETTQFVVAVLSALVAVVSGFLSRRHESGAVEVRDRVGMILTVGMAALVVILPAFLMVTALKVSGVPIIGPNGQNVLSLLIGGAIGTLGAYLGLERSDRDDGAGAPQSEPDPE